MVVWLIPLSLFPTLAALYLGGAPLRIEGRGARELVGLILSFALYLVVWAVLRGVLAGPLGTAGSTVLATVLSVISIPGVTWIGFRVMGVRIQRIPRRNAGHGHAHG